MRKTVSEIILRLLLIGMLTLAFNFQPVEARFSKSIEDEFGRPMDLSVEEYSLSYTIPLGVVFIGFRQEAVDTTLVDSNIAKSYQFDYLIENYTVAYSFSMNYYFADSAYYQALKTFCLANSVNGTGTTSALNTPALEIQILTGERMSIFRSQSGRAIDAIAVEEWFQSNPYISNSDHAYWFYVINFTEFDSPDHHLEHWYNTTELDLEADHKRDFWRLEWDNTLNPDVRFPYACFTSDSRVFFIDPSAFQWYLTWARMWWNLQVPGGPKYRYYFEDLDQFLATHDVSTTQGKTDLAYYLAGWIEDPIRNLLAPSLWTDTQIAEANSMSMQILVLNNASHLGYTNNVMQWIINSTIIEQAIIDLAPYMNVRVDVEFHNLSSYPQLEAIFANAVVRREADWVYYDISEIWDNLYALRESYFNLSVADIVINGYVLLEKNMSMMLGDKEFTGAGGDGQILIMKELGRYFQEDGVSPKSGLGHSLIHEAGHNLGFSHTFEGFQYAGDFAFDVMGYYPYSYHFTQMRKDCWQRLVADLKKPRFLPTDLNEDGTVNILDISIVAMTFGTESGDEDWNETADLDKNGEINILDIAAVAIHFGETLEEP